MMRDDRTKIRLVRRVHTPPDSTTKGGPVTRSSVDEGSLVWVVADPFGDRCSTGERLAFMRPYGDAPAQSHTCRHRTARTWGPARWTHTREHAGRSRSRREHTRAKTSLEYAAMSIANRWKYKRRESILFWNTSSECGRKLIVFIGKCNETEWW